MNYILAVSGGVDSVVLLDIVLRVTRGGATPENVFVKDKKFSGVDREAGPAVQFIIAHFDHGVRAESGEDAQFVGELAQKYGVIFELGEGKLGQEASEEAAREARYKFLSKLQKKYAPAKVVTAHHQDDLVETIVMNLIRGTGWRGLAPMRADLERPLLGFSKVELVEYALKNRLNWVEDQTNYGSQYFRNRVRNFLLKMTPEQRQNLLILNAKQQLLREQIEKTLERIHQPETIQIKALLDLPPKLALEFLRTWTNQKLTTPQLKSLLKKLTTAKTGDLIQPGGKIQIGVYQGQLTITELSIPLLPD